MCVRRLGTHIKKDFHLNNSSQLSVAAMADAYCEATRTRFFSFNILINASVIRRNGRGTN